MVLIVLQLRYYIRFYIYVCYVHYTTPIILNMRKKKMENMWEMVWKKSHQNIIWSIGKRKESYNNTNIKSINNNNISILVLWWCMNAYYLLWNWKLDEMYFMYLHICKTIIIMLFNIWKMWRILLCDALQYGFMKSCPAVVADDVMTQ